MALANDRFELAPVVGVRLAVRDGSEDRHAVAGGRAHFEPIGVRVGALPLEECLGNVGRDDPQVPLEVRIEIDHRPDAAIVLRLSPPSTGRIRKSGPSNFVKGPVAIGDAVPRSVNVFAADRVRHLVVSVLHPLQQCRSVASDDLAI